MAESRNPREPADSLAQELERLREEAEDKAVLERLVYDLKVHQEELRAQQDDLIETQRALEASRDRYVDLFDFSPLGYVTLDHNGVVREANLTLARLLGVERGRLPGWPFIVNVVEGERRLFVEHMRRCRGSDAAVKTELTLKTRDGRTVAVELLSRRMGASDVEDACYHTSLVDLTDRRQAEQERRRAEAEEARGEAARAASEAKDRFFAMLSHELRTPLTPVLFAISALLENGGVPDSMRPTLGMIRRNVEMEARLIDDLLDITRIVRDKLRLERETVDVHEAVRDVADMLTDEFRTRQVALVCALDAGEHHVFADPVRLRQAVANLVKNAVRHTPPGGRVTLASANHARGMVRLTVTDAGVGIEPAALARIFELFEQGPDRNRGDGLGIGLAVCKGIVEAHDGRIAAASEGRGRGACFEIELATVEAPAERDATSPQGIAARGPGRRILLVEDNRDNSQAMSCFLGARGYQITVAASVQEALRHAGEPYDLVISDIGLPDGTGYDVIRRLSQQRRVPAIALSGYGAESDIQRSAAAGFDRHLTKPIDPEQLIDAIEGLDGDAAVSRDPVPTRAASRGR